MPGFTDAYLDALDDAAQAQPRTTRDRDWDRRTADLAEWHLLLLDQLADTDAEDRLDRIARHPALGGPELQYLQARLVHRRGDLAGSRHLMEQCLESLPGHTDFLQIATDIDAELPPRARQIVEEQQRFYDRIGVCRALVSAGVDAAAALRSRQAPGRSRCAARYTALWQSVDAP